MNRPIAKPTQLPPAPNQPTKTQTPSHLNGFAIDVASRQVSQDEIRASVWSEDRSSRPTRNSIRARSEDRQSQASDVTWIPPVRSHRADTKNGRPGVNPPKVEGVFKVIIDGAIPRQAAPGDATSPSLEVPIPNYKLGTPRFSTQGTAFLHSSIYGSNSALEDSLFPAPPGLEHRSVLSRRHSHTSPQPFTVRIAPSVENKAPLVTSTPTFHRSADPITASLYDYIAAHPNDLSIVRYGSSTRDITAATPARIVAQITSPDFVDYELISDFFLTVRSYLSTHDLAAYLLARFEWAIDRPNDDGQVIRVRVFAALRHWILNYFPYDFVTDRDLRVKFCDRLNAMSKNARDRTNGPSDMKLILDLKKCWNGRCALFWDPPIVGTDNKTDLEINPGGIAGSRDSRLTHPSQLRPKPSDPPPPPPPPPAEPDNTTLSKTAALNSWLDGTIDQVANSSANHERQSSATTTHTLPTSPISEQSIQAMSCTLPGKGLKRFLVHSGPSMSAHPVTQVPVMRRVCPAAPSATSNEPKPQAKPPPNRSGSFSDAVRDRRASLPSMNTVSADQSAIPSPYPGSLVRGNMLPPGLPYIDGFAPSSPTEELFGSEDSDSDSDRTEVEYGSDEMNRSPHLGPGVKAFLGNIRRALSSKQYPGLPPGVTSHHISTPNLGSKGLKSSKSRFLKQDASKQTTDHSNKEMRIDFLCADVTAMFQRALLLESAGARKDAGLTGPISGGGQRDHPSIEAKVLSTQSALPPKQRNPSQTTYGSRSIVIFNETGEHPPVPQVPLKYSEVPSGHRHEDVQEVNLMLGQVSAEEPLERRLGPDGHVLSQQELQNNKTNSLSARDTGHAALNSTVQSNPLERGASADKTNLVRNKSYRSSNTDSRSLRKFASYQSGMTRRIADNTITTRLEDNSAYRASKTANAPPQQRMLRRRPGGDLRANENVHDLEPLPRPKSTGSIATFSESARGSELFARQPLKSSWDKNSQKIGSEAQNGLAQSVVRRIPSLVRTLSQPALRPSFEAAVKEFAQIPDDEGGDIEATILKLEGKYRKQRAEATKPEVVVQPVQEPPTDSLSEAVQQIARDGTTKDDQGPDAEANLSVTAPTRLHGTPHRDNMTLSVYAESEESYDSTPLLARSSSQKPKKVIPSKQSDEVSKPRPLFSREQSYEDSKSNDTELLDPKDAEDENMRRSRYVSSIPTTTDSFLLDEDEFLSDLSSELSFATVHPDDRPQEEPYGSTPNIGLRDTEAPATLSSTHPPSPPMTSDKPLPQFQNFDPTQYQRKPPTPDPSPVSRIKGATPNNASNSPFEKGPLPIQISEFPPSQHLPFILCYDAQTLAQQFTLVEKDALSEVSWQDLVNMRWHHTSPSTLNWVEYLQTQDPTGIELVTARFNIIVKWCLSEIILTQNLGERALVILKFIHIARQCRKIHNYATMFQLTIALTSVDCSRLTRTWALIPQAEKRAVTEMERLVSPVRNFARLREEMEISGCEEEDGKDGEGGKGGGDGGGGGGVVPVIGMSSFFDPCLRVRDKFPLGEYKITNNSVFPLQRYTSTI